MGLPAVGVAMHAPGDAPSVTVGGVIVQGVRSVQITATQDHLPQVSLVLVAQTVDVQIPAQVSVLQTGPSPAAFAEEINPARLEGLATQHLELHDVTTGEAFAAALGVLAAEFERTRD